MPLSWFSSFLYCFMPHANSLLLPVSYTQVLLQFLPQLGDSSRVNSIYLWDIPRGICNKRRNLAILLYAFFWVITRRLNFLCRRFGTLFHLHRRPMKNEQSAPKRRHIKFRRLGITQEKAYNIQNKAKVWNLAILQDNELCYSAILV